MSVAKVRLWIERAQDDTISEEDLDRYLANALAALDSDDWISVEERLPEESGLYIIHKAAITEGYATGVGVMWFWPAGYFEDGVEHEWEYEDPHHRVTYWRPLPAPPREASDD